MSYLDGLDSERRQRLLQLAASRPQPAAAPPPPHGHVSAADAARLRVRAHTLAEENASLRRNLQAMVAQAKRSESELQALRRTATAKQQRTEQQHATTAAVLEEQAARQQRALLDLARTAQSLAAENAQLHGRLAALQDENQDAERAQQALQERLAQLQHLCLELDRQPPAGGGGGCSSGGSGSVPPGSLSAGAAGDRAAAGSGRQAELLERLSCTLRALGPANGSPLGPQPAAVLPPATAPGKVQAAAKGLPIDLRLALRELEGLRKERDGLASKLKAAEAQAAKLRAEQEQARQSLVRERHATAAATAELQRQLKTARERAEGLAKRCKDKEAVLAERDTYVAALEQRLLRRRKPGAAGAAGDGSPSRPGAAAAAGAGRRAASDAGQASAETPGLAALPHSPGSPACLWQPLDGWEGQREVSLADLQQAAEATAAACVQGGGFTVGGWMPSPGADSTIASDSPERELPQRRLHWADEPSRGPQQAQQQDEEEWAAYQLGSPSPCPAHHQSRLARVGAGSNPVAPGGVSSNPLFSFHPRGGGVAPSCQMEDVEALAALGDGSTYVNDLFCGGPQAAAPSAEPPMSVGLPLPPHKRLGAGPAGRRAAPQPQRAGNKWRQEQHLTTACAGAASSPVELGALPARMPSGEFESVSALLEALTPGSQAALGAAPVAQRAALGAAPGHARPTGPPAVTRYPAASTLQPTAAAECTPPGALLAAGQRRPVSGGMEGSVERKLQDAVARFFSETAQKGGRPPPDLVPPPPSQRGGRQPGSAERVAALSALAKRQQRRRPAGAAEEQAGQAPAMKQGRLNRAADQQAGRGRQQQWGGGQWSPAAAVCYA